MSYVQTPPSARPAWPAQNLETWPLEALAAYERNAKQHPPEQVADIARSMQRFGFTIPILVAEDGVIIAGHGRVLAARQLLDGGDERFRDVPVLVARGWTDEQRRAYTLADNRLSENGAWDEELIRLELGDLRALDFDVSGLGFDPGDISRLLDAPPEEEFPDLPGGERSILPQMTFTLSEAQVALVKRALSEAKARGARHATDEDNENSNGRALAVICQAYLDANG